VDIRVIQGLLGHRSLRTTVVYLHLTQATLKAVQATIDQLMGDL
jgi:site-specific recombinase XerD